MSLRRTLIVITPDQVDAANRAVAEHTGNPADELTFTVPILDKSDTVIGYIASWDLEATGVDYDEIRKVVESSVGAPKDAAASKRVSASGDLVVRKVLTYDAERVAADEVLAHLGGTKGDDGPSVTVIG